MAKKKDKKVNGKYTLEPMGSHLVIRPDARETTSPGGIVLPDDVDEESMTGVVVAVGPGSGEPPVPLKVKVGDRVLYSPYSESFVMAGERLVIIQEKDLYAILR